jgi:hypothetical protein
MVDDPDPIAAGEEGTVEAVSSLGWFTQVHVNWDCGRTLMLVVPPDIVEVL